MKSKKLDFLKTIKENIFLLVFLLSALVLLAISAVMLVSMNNSVRSMNSTNENLNNAAGVLTYNYAMRLKTTAASAQDLLSYIDIEKLLERPTRSAHEDWFGESGDAYFLELRQTLLFFAEKNALEYVYYYLRFGDRILPFIDNDPVWATAYSPAHKLEPIEEPIRKAWNEKVIVVVGEDTDDKFIDDNSLITAYAPILNDKDEVVAIVGVDIKDDQMSVLQEQIKILNANIARLSKNTTLLSAGTIVALILLLAGAALTFAAGRKRALALSDALTQAKHASRAKSDFLANMSHEMRTPLNAVIGMTKIARDADSAERKEYCLSKIEEASAHLLGVINDVLDYSKIEAAKFELVNVEFAFEKTLQKVCDVISFKVAEKRQVFNISTDKKIPCTLIGDDQHLAQVIANLLSNAVKFTPENGSIALNSTMDGEKNGNIIIRVEVSDTGIGISEEQKERLFRSFEQADNTITKRFGGTGLGLAISKRIVEMMDGEIYVKSELGKGSAFGFTVPFKRGKEQAESPRPAAAETADEEEKSDDFTGRRVLVVDDVEINREIVLALLEPTGISTDCAENGAAALKMFSENPDRYDLIFMDVQMPEMNGYEATKRIRGLNTEKAKKIPIIAMTANAFREDVESSLAAGMNAHIAKPIDFKEVLEKLREYL